MTETTTKRRVKAYGWIIDRDHEASAELGDEGNTIGPRDIDDYVLARLHAGEGVPFRMFTDDDELLYTGRVIARKEERDGEFDHKPLDDFGMPNAGCTRIDVKRNGKWSTV